MRTMMSLEQAIEHAEDTAKSAIGCECRDEHRQRPQVVAPLLDGGWLLLVGVTAQGLGGYTVAHAHALLLAHEVNLRE